MDALLIGYARVSTDEQDLTAQRDALAALGARVSGFWNTAGSRRAPRLPYTAYVRW